MEVSFCCLTSTESRRPIRNGIWSGGKGRLYTSRYAVITRMTPALRSSAIRAILMFHFVRDKVTNKMVSTDHNF